MKKFLSLVLALTMMMSLVTINAGAKEFTDDEELNYKEAVDVISEISVVDGYEDGSFKPQNTLTRGAAAKIICNLILGPTTAAELHADTAPYKDVPVSNTFSGYIAYCAKEGIISGYADGSFRPAGTLTGYAFMKMLLGALGYDATYEGYTGGNWSINVAKQAIGIGLNKGLVDEFNGVDFVTREEAARRIADGTLTDVLNAVPVKAGDVFFIDAGTVHAIGAGILIAEIQQNSNTTYRVFDYGRLGADGKPRALHVEKALDVARLCPPERPAGPMGKPEKNGDCTSTLLAKCGYFTARLLDVAGSAPLCADGESFHSLLCLSGSGAVICGGGAVPFAKGDSLFLPAGLGAYTIAGRAQLVLTTL